MVTTLVTVTLISVSSPDIELYSDVKADPLTKLPTMSDNPPEKLASLVDKPAIKLAWLVETLSVTLIETSVSRLTIVLKSACGETPTTKLAIVSVTPAIKSRVPVVVLAIISPSFAVTLFCTLILISGSSVVTIRNS